MKVKTTFGDKGPIVVRTRDAVNSVIVDGDLVVSGVLTFDYDALVEEITPLVVTASVNTIPDSVYQLVDGRIWYFPEITNRWTTQGSSSTNDWIEIDFGKARELSMIKIYLFADGRNFTVPDSVIADYQTDAEWQPVKLSRPDKLTGNTVNTMKFDKITASKIRLNFRHSAMHVAVVEVECY